MVNHHAPGNGRATTYESYGGRTCQQNVTVGNSYQCIFIIRKQQLKIKKEMMNYKPQVTAYHLVNCLANSTPSRLDSSGVSSPGTKDCRT